jgi:hypothetical protein
MRINLNSRLKILKNASPKNTKTTNQMTNFCKAKNYKDIINL